VQDVDELAAGRSARRRRLDRKAAMILRTWMSGHRCAPGLRVLSSALPDQALVVSRRASRCHTEAALRLRTGGLRSPTPLTKSARGSNRHDQNVLTSRAACRSRPRQLAQIPMVVERRCHRGMNAELLLAHPHLCILTYISTLCRLMHRPPSLNHLSTTTPTHAFPPHHHSILTTYLILCRNITYESRETLDIHSGTVYSWILIDFSRRSVIF
jgi:hypothetical protein